MTIDWKGDIAFSDSVAIFRGQVGENHAHAHWASQITVALDGELVFETDAGTRRAKAAYFTSKTTHRIEPGPWVCSIYFDPLHESLLKALEGQAREGFMALSADELPPELAGLTTRTDLRALLDSDLLAPVDQTHPRDARFRTVIGEIRERLADGDDIDRKKLAALANLSPTRFSHWFVEHAGVPVRSYKKWLKLRVAMDALLDGTAPMDAAMQAGFSDLAHMCRAFSESFGLTYLDALKALQQSTRY